MTRKCNECGCPTEYSTCDTCWQKTLLEIADEHAKALAEREEMDGC